MALVAILQEILGLGLQAAPWLLLGLVVAGLIKACVPEALLQRLVGGDGIGAIGRAAVIGAPLPLCSCGAIPTALMLHRNGAGRGPTTAFMVATPGIGADSVALTYALLGPVIMLARVLGALVSAVLTGLFVAAGSDRSEACRVEPASACSPESASTGASCSTGCRGPALAAAPEPGIGERLRNGLSYAFNDLFEDIGGWMLGGLVLAGLIVWAVPPQAFAAIATGIPAMLLMAVIGIPIYICATAATPIAVAMMLAGASPGTVLVFLLAGPITSMATLAVLQREMGTPAVARYLAGIVATTVLAGFLLDQAIGWSDLDVMATMGAAQDVVPDWLEWGALTVLVLLALRPARRMLLRPA
jgi:uncharacterized protein